MNKGSLKLPDLSPFRTYSEFSLASLEDQGYYPSSLKIFKSKGQIHCFTEKQHFIYPDGSFALFPLTVLHTGKNNQM